MKKILNKVKEYDTIIIHRHANPDLDAIGSQIGLREIIKANFPDKKVYVVGDENRFCFIGKMDHIEDDIYENSLVIICDVAVAHMISDYRYMLAKEIVVIDHHQNPVDLAFNGEEYHGQIYSLIKPNYIACAELIADISKHLKLKITPLGATALYGGITTDSGRFQYGNDLENAFLVAAYLMKNGADPQFIYRNLYVETLEMRLMKNYFQSKMQLTKNNVGYMFNDKDVFEKFKVDFFTVSRGMVNLMAGIDKVKIWANFTYDSKTDKVIGEFRSRDISIVDIAKKYGGGGHECACGATLNDFAEAKQVLDDFDKLLEDTKNV